MKPFFNDLQLTTQRFYLVIVGMITSEIHSNNSFTLSRYAIGKYFSEEDITLLMEFNFNDKTWTVSMDKMPCVIPGVHGRGAFGSYESPYARYSMKLSVECSHPFISDEIFDFYSFLDKDKFFHTNSGAYKDKPENPFAHINVTIDDFKEVDNGTKGE